MKYRTFGINLIDTAECYGPDPLRPRNTDGLAASVMLLLGVSKYG